MNVIRRGIEAFNRRDAHALAQVTTADFAWFPALPGTVEANGYQGREGLDTYFAEVSAIWEELSVIPDEVRDLGETAVVLGRAEGRGRASGVRVDTPFGIVFEFRDGKASYCRAYLDPAEALKAVVGNCFACS